MNISTVAPFVDAVAQVGEQLLHRVPTRGELSVAQDLVTSYPINVLTGITGDLEGVVMFGMTRSSALAIAEAILGKKPRVMDQSVSTALAHFGQLVLSEEAHFFHLPNLKVTLTAPAIVRGTGITVPTHGQPTLIIPLDFEGIGSICVKVSVSTAHSERAA